MEDVLRKYGKIQEVLQLDTAALGKRIQEKAWEPEVLEAIKRYAELERSKRLYVSKMKE